MSNDFSSIIKTFVKDIVKQANKDCIKALNEVNNELHFELIKMYDTYINTFYNYPTTSYIRHGMTAPGSGGENLYKPSAGIMKTNGWNPQLIVNLNGSTMDGKNYKYDSTDTVFDYVMSGTRYPYFNPMDWTGSYHGKYFSCAGTLQTAFAYFDVMFEDIAWKAFLTKWKLMGY